MGALPIQHYISTALDNHVQKLERIVEPSSADPLHVNFL
tara:strand:- start:1313 stop:1429 length:117 start_codon:yes stop_codon:yes gene_type:complete